jgi:UDP-GlcNAc:undecaprenyl-phosphate GlcNAc-1-phosphate transferase
MNAVVIKPVFALLISFLVTFYLVPFFCNLARRLKFVDEPDGKIKRHKEPTPYMGGLAVYIGFLASLCLTLPLENNMLLFFVGATLLLCVGLVDDLLVLKPYQKFFGQILAMLCFLKAGLYLKEHFFYSFWNLFISGFWILLIINAFNLVDVMDGLATLLAICATTSFLAFAIYFNQSALVLLLCAFLGALTAFLWYNRPNAQIYLGDAGSLFIGGFLATVPFFFKWGTYNVSGYLTPIVILAIPLLEVSTLILVRTYKGIPFYMGSPDHFSIYLQQNGWSKAGILKYVFALSIVLFMAAYSFALNELPFVGLLMAAALFVSVWYIVIAHKPNRQTRQNYQN